jgi:GMP synthase (glutamine-hydrolysing)
MISLINFRKANLLNNKSFTDEDELDSHIKIIEEENKVSKKNARMAELKNWLDLLY